MSRERTKGERDFKIFLASGGGAAHQAAGAMVTKNPEPPLAGPYRD